MSETRSLFLAADAADDGSSSEVIIGDDYDGLQDHDPGPGFDFRGEGYAPDPPGLGDGGGNGGSDPVESVGEFSEDLSALSDITDTAHELWEQISERAHKSAGNIATQPFARELIEHHPDVISRFDQTISDRMKMLLNLDKAMNVFSVVGPIADTLEFSTKVWKTVTATSDEARNAAAEELVVSAGGMAVEAYVTKRLGPLGPAAGLLAEKWYEMYKEAWKQNPEGMAAAYSMSIMWR